MTLQRLILLAATAGLATVALAEAPDSAESAAVYESIDDIVIGRVFLSPAERQQLDAIRHLPAQATAVPSGTSPAPVAEAPKPKGVGFIRRTGKATRVFKDGDFVTAQPGKRVITEVTDGVIVRHEDDAGDDSP